MAHVFFFGKSGVGKSTLIEFLLSDPFFYVPTHTVTRPPRQDDLPGRFDHTDTASYLRLRAEGALIYDADDGQRYHGIQRRALRSDERIALCYGSPYCLPDKTQGAFQTILVEGDAQKGLHLRGDPPDQVNTRMEMNRMLDERFYSQPFFRQKMNIIITNTFQEIESLAESVRDHLVRMGA